VLGAAPGQALPEPPWRQPGVRSDANAGAQPQRLPFAV